MLPETLPSDIFSSTETAKLLDNMSKLFGTNDSKSPLYDTFPSRILKLVNERAYTSMH